MDPIAIKWVIEPIEWLIQRFTARRAQRTDEKKSAIEALLKALNETRIYFGTLRVARTPDRDKEEEISRLWVGYIGDNPAVR